MTVVRTARRRDRSALCKTATVGHEKKRLLERGHPLAEAPMREAQAEKSDKFKKIVERLKEVPEQEEEPGVIDNVVKRLKGIKKSVGFDNDRLIDEALDSEIPSEVVARGPLAICKVEG